MIIRLACQGTFASGFLDGRAYDIDDIQVCASVTVENFRTSFKDGKIFEVSVLVWKQYDQAISVCPSCEHDPRAVIDDRLGETSTIGRWIRWYVSLPPSCNSCPSCVVDA